VNREGNSEPKSGPACVHPHGSREAHGFGDVRFPPIINVVGENVAAEPQVFDPPVEARSGIWQC